MSLYEVVDFRDNRRFYPYGQHPAVARIRHQLELVEATPTTESSLAIREHIWRNLFMFEAGETDAKIRWLQHERDRMADALEALVEFAWHDRSCQSIDGDGEWRSGNKPCDCGYDKAREMAAAVGA